MNTTLKTLLCLLPMAVAGFAHGRPLDATGPCPQGAMLSIADGDYRGDAQVMKRNADFAKRHEIASREEEPAIKALAWRSSQNRMYREGAQSVIVVTMCDPANCERHRDYVGYEPSTGIYGGIFYEGRHVREFGSSPQERIPSLRILSAVTCAQNLDWSNK